MLPPSANNTHPRDSMLLGCLDLVLDQSLVQNIIWKSEVLGIKM